MKRPRPKSLKRKQVEVAIDEEEEVKSLRSRYEQLAEDNTSGTQRTNTAEVSFADMPISSRTQKGLAAESMITATDIQIAAISHGLLGRDILGAAKTGSGKTLAFLVPLLEKLFMERWSSEDGLAALIVTPTRELAMQIFEVLRKIGKYHEFSAGLVTGGKKEFDEEQLHVVLMNILVCTPGRLLQHLEITPGFDASQLQILILDEADRILDLGFKAQLDGILSYLPPRQTLLFSATQTKSVKDLARLSLNSPEYLAVHSEEEDATPKSLIQNYIITDIEEKLDTLFSFVKTHLKSKIIVFFSTCSQVRFAFECFRSMQPGITLCALHGKIKQERRTLIYMDFVRRPCSCLFATDIAARGLDFPNVDWVLQFDAPEDPAAYIHRVGRTARYNAGGRALMMLLPTEEHAVVNSLTSAGVPIKKLTMNKKHAVSVSLKASALLVSRPECRELAKKAFCGYLKALQLLPDRERNNISGLNVDSYAKSLGLAITPQVPLIANGGTEGREVLRESKNVNRKLDKLKTSIKEAKEERKRLREGQAPKAVEKKVPIDAEGGEEELFSVKRVHEWAKEAAAGDLETMEVVSNNKKAKLLKIGIDGKAKIKSSVGPKKIIFNDDDEVVEPFRFEAPVTAGVVDRLRIEGHLERIRQRVDDGREEDLERERERIRLKHREQRQATKGPRADEDEGPQAMLCTAQDDESEYENDAESNDHDSNNKDDDSDAIEDDATDEDGEEDVESLKQREIVAMRMLHSKQRR